MSNELILSMDKSSLTPESLADKGVVLVDFWAPWCNPCRMLAPVLDQLAEEFNGQATIGKVNIDEQEDAAVEFSVASIPTIILFKDGMEVERLVGVRPRQQLAEFIRKYL